MNIIWGEHNYIHLSLYSLKPLGKREMFPYCQDITPFILKWEKVVVFPHVFQPAPPDGDMGRTCCPWGKFTAAVERFPPTSLPLWLFAWHSPSCSLFTLVYFQPLIYNLLSNGSCLPMDTYDLITLTLDILFVLHSAKVHYLPTLWNSSPNSLLP